MEFTKIRSIARGKTKEVFEINKYGLALFVSSDDLTAGDGAKHNIVKGKAALANLTTCNVFRFLNQCGIPTSFVEQVDKTSFVGDLCNMIPYEVVVRREAYGSYLGNYPYLQKGHLFQKLIVQFFLKTSGKKWLGLDIPVDDPLAIFTNDDKMDLFLPNIPITSQIPFMTLDDYPLKGYESKITEIKTIAAKTFLALEKAWQQVEGNRRLIDFKLEFGISYSGRLVLADVIDSDSWRVVDRDGAHLDKQLYRDGADTATVLDKYKTAADLTSRFKLPSQQIIIWTGSEKDNISPITSTLEGYSSNSVKVTPVVCSMHKQPIEGIYNVNRLIQDIPDAVIIDYIGLSNGAGPCLSANVSIPVINVPANYNESPIDVFSSLNTPSFVPCTTAVNPKNAALEALKILSMRNPQIYMNLRHEQEKLLANFLIL